MKTAFAAAAAAVLFCAALGDAARSLPVDGGTVTSGIGWRRDPFGSGRLVYHSGIDISVPTGTPVHPTQNGYVTYAGVLGGYGNTVAIVHGDGYMTVYGHNSSVDVKPGDWVDTRTVIARSGNTGRSTAPHVHYEVRHYRGSQKEQLAQLVQDIRSRYDEERVAPPQGAPPGQGG